MSKSVPNPSQKGVPEKSKNVVQEKPKPSVADKAKEVGSEKSKTVDSKKTPEVVPDKSKEAVSDKSKELVPDKSKEGDPKKPKEAEADKSKETKSTEVVAEKPPEVILERATSVVLYPDLFPEEPPSLEAELKRGARELKLRQRKTQRERSRKKKKDVDPKVTKIVFPETPKFPGCHHNETIVIERELLRPEEHIKLLAMPKEKVSSVVFRTFYKANIQISTSQFRNTRASFKYQFHQQQTTSRFLPNPGHTTSRTPSTAMASTSRSSRSSA